MSGDEMMSDDEWRQKLTPEQYAVLREKGTEAPFAGELLDEKREGMFTCAACGFDLFASKDKYDSGSGWPSFTKPVTDDAVTTEEDTSLPEVRTEVLCPRCGGHLGHVFPDGPTSAQGYGGQGPEPTGKRYCINSAALAFQPGDEPEV